METITKKKAESKKRQKPEYEIRMKQIHAIKDRLSYIQKLKKDENINQLLDKLEKMYHYNIQYNTLRTTLSSSEDTLDSICLIALCRYWNLNLSTLLASPDAEPEYGDRATQYLDKEAFVPVYDEAYSGNFHCYMYPRSNHHDNQIWHGYLTITLTDGNACAKLEIHETNDTGKKPKVKKFEGYAYHALMPNNIILNLSNHFGSYCFINFIYEPYDNNGKMYYRTAAFTSYTINKSKIPRIQKMIILDHEASEDSLNYISGLLKMDTESLIIRSEEFENIVSQNELVRHFYDKYHDELSIRHHDCIIFDPTKLDDKIKPITDDDMKAIMLLSGHTLSAENTEMTFFSDRVPSLSQDF